MKNNWHKAMALIAILWWLTMVIVNHRDGFIHFEWLLEDVLWKVRWTFVGEGPPSKVSLVLITRDNVENLCGGHFQWPLNRAYIGKLLDELRKSGACSVGFDMMFSADEKTPGDPELESAIASWGGSVVLGTELKGTVLSAISQDDDSEGYGGIAPSKVLPEFLKSAWGMSSFNFVQNSDGGEIPRETPLYFHVDKKPFPGLALGTYLAGNKKKITDLGIGGDSLKTFSGESVPFREIKGGTETFDADRLITPAFPKDYISRFGVSDLPFTAMVLNPEQGQKVKERRDRLKDSYVLVGVGDDLLGDTIQLPNQKKKVPGIVLHAAILDSLTSSGMFMKRLSGGKWLWIGDILAFVLVISVLFFQAKMSPLAGFCSNLGLFFFSIVAVGAAFCKGTIISWAVIWPAFIGTLLLSYFYGFLFEGQEKKAIREMFSKQVSPDVVNELLEKSGEIMTAKRQEVSVAFLDVCGFTTFSEKHSPERVLVQLNHYFGFFIPEIMRQRGTIDKIIGDALMITTGVPLADPEHAFQMVSICMNVRRKIEEINKNLPEGFEAFTLSCGVNSGDVILGNVGSPERMEYTVIGDTVNLAARLQSVSKSQEIVVGPLTYERTKDRIKYEPLPPLHVKGKAEEIKAYKVIEK